MDILDTLRSICDRMQKQSDCHLIDEEVGKRQVNLLLYSEDDYFYYEKHFGIIPKNYQNFAITYFYLILKQFEKDEEDNLKRIENKYPDISKDQKKFLNMKPSEYFATKTNELTKQLKGIQKIQQISKISRYFTFYINGGLLNTYFTLDTLLEKFENLQNEEKNEILKIMDQLLYIYPIEDKTITRDVKQLDKRLQEIQKDKKYDFNESIMKILLQRGFIANQMINSDSSDKYSDLLISILDIKNLILQETICRHVIVTQQQKKSEKIKADKSEEMLRKAMKNLVSPISKLFGSQNRTLSTLATAALVNLASQAEDIKRQLFDDQTFQLALIYISKYGYGYPGLLQFSLQLIYSLSAIQTHIQEFSLKYSLIESIINVLEKKQDHPFLINIDSIQISFCILRVILGNAKFGLKQITGQIKLYNKFLLPAEYPEKIISNVILLYIKIIASTDEQKAPLIISQIYEASKENFLKLLNYTGDEEEYGGEFVEQMALLIFYFIKHLPNERQELISEITTIFKKTQNEKLITSLRGNQQK